MHSAHTQGPISAHAAPRPHARPALGAVSWPPSYRVAGASFRVSVLTRTLSRRVVAPLSRYKKLYHDTEPMPRTLHAVSCTHNAMSQRASAHSGAVSLPPIMIQNLYQDTPPWPGRARGLLLAPTRKPAVSRIAARVARPAARPCGPVAYCVKIQSVVS